MKYLFILFLLSVSITNLHAQSSSIMPTQRIKDIGYLEIKPITLLATTMTGNIVFINSSPPYSIQVPLSRIYDDFGQHQLTTTDYQSQMDGVLGYGLNSIVSTFPVSSVRIELQVHGSSMIIRLKINLIVTTAIFSNYMQFGQKTITNPMSPQFFVNQDVPNTKFIPLVKSFITTYTGTLGSVPESQGFKTFGSKVFDVNNTMVYQVYFDKTPSNGNFTISVTYVVIQINQVQYKKTAQFSNLQYSWTSGYTNTSSQTIIPLNYNFSYLSDMITSPNEFANINSQKSFYSIISDTKGITLSTNNINSIAQYSFIDYIDVQCPSTHVYKKKGDSLCYTCPNVQMILGNGNSVWSQLNSTFTNPICSKLNLTMTMFQFDSTTGKVKSVCGYCRLCTTEYYLQQGVCKQCNKSIQGCVQCSSNTTCYQCLTGYFLQSTTCKLCNNSIANCLLCNSSKSCQQCQSGFYFQPLTTKCLICNLTMQYCGQCSNGSVCQYCIQGYFMNVDRCESCSEHIVNCLQCGSSGICTKCKVGYFADNNGVCKLCNQTISNCVQCSTKSNCTLCQNGYQFTYSNENDLMSDKHCSFINLTTIEQKIINETNTKQQLITQTITQESAMKNVLTLSLGIGLPLIIFAPIVFCIIKKQFYDISSVSPQPNNYQINSNQLHLNNTQRLTQQIVAIKSQTILFKLQNLIGRLLDRFDNQSINSRLDINLNVN